MFSISHWLFYILVLLIIVLIILRKQPMLLAAGGLLVIGFSIEQNFISALDIAYRSLILVATNLLPVIILIGLVVAMTGLLKDTGSSSIITQPFTRLKGSGKTYWVIGLFMWGLTLLIWPTPAATLLGAVALTLHKQGKAHPMAIAMSLSIFGEGLGLSGDFLIQGTPTLTSKITGIPLDSIISFSWPFVLISGFMAAIVGALRVRTFSIMQESKPKEQVEEENNSPQKHEAATKIAWVVIGGYAIIILSFIMEWSPGQGASGMAGGITLLILIIGSILKDKEQAFASFIEYLRKGLRFSMEVFTPIVVMSGFFMLGTATGNREILGGEGIGYLGDFAQYLSNTIPLNKWSAGLFVIISAALGSMDGSGFSGLALASGVAVAMSEAVNVSTLPFAILGQIAAIWTGAVLVPWGFNAVIAAVVGVEPIDLARNNLVAYFTAIGTAYLTIVAII